MHRLVLFAFVLAPVVSCTSTPSDLPPCVDPNAACAPLDDGGDAGDAAADATMDAPGDAADAGAE